MGYCIKDGSQIRNNKELDKENITRETDFDEDSLWKGESAPKISFSQLFLRIQKYGIDFLFFSVSLGSDIYSFINSNEIVSGTLYPWLTWNSCAHEEVLVAEIMSFGTVSEKQKKEKFPRNEEVGDKEMVIGIVTIVILQLNELFLSIELLKMINKKWRFFITESSATTGVKKDAPFFVDHLEYKTRCVWTRVHLVTVIVVIGTPVFEIRNQRRGTIGFVSLELRASKCENCTKY